ncbi:hypothetical protein F441_02305 [Phytophthora nicotianae CJ01A1]|uniref:Uncharacterized protein n=2 Tax=Phytophthora nicotianae TaxID=4792 RepID=W2ZZF7_PHYNI|nr:hypothetical protein F441_02305 [Phytophthora nicotianae CJ01A1]ETP52742.1 hypothetical protein F442_02308 [Phytophthora nicotianae P10297]
MGLFTDALEVDEHVRFLQPVKILRQHSMVWTTKTENTWLTSSFEAHERENYCDANSSDGEE